MSPPANQQAKPPLDLPNLATARKAAGYSVPFKGKWHLQEEQKQRKEYKRLTKKLSQVEKDRLQPL